jgi:YVTN family beta-propeller protein
VTITVTPVNDAPVANGGSVTTNEDTATNGTLTGTDPEGSALTYAIVTQPTKGTITNFNAQTGTYTYTPGANLNGADTFTFTVSDGTTTSTPATVTITITPVNDAPVANAGTLTTNEDTAKNGTLTGTDPDVGQTLTYAITTQPTKGTITNFNAQTGTYTYTPSANLNGADTFTFTVSDGTTTSAAATVTITVTPVNDAPVANPDSYTVAQGGTLTVPAATGPLANDTDVDGDSLTAIGATQPAHGTVVGSPNGSFTYKPTAGYSGTDSFTYSVSDGKGGIAVGTVTITVTPVNQAPVANAGTLATNEDTATTGTLTGTDPENAALTYTIVTQPTKGTISDFNATTGTYTYTPAANLNGADSFTFTVSDGSLTSAPATVTINVAAVDDAPVAGGDTYTVAQDHSVTKTLPATDIDSGALTYAISQQPTNGTITDFNAATGTYTYTPGANYAGPDSFTYTVSDGTTTTAPATVSITVAPDLPPVANDSTIVTDEDTPITSNLSATDPDSTTLTYTIVTQPTNGTISNLNPTTGNFIYTPNANVNGPDSFTFTVSDGTTTSAPATVTITVTAVNDIPVANGDEFTAIAGTPVDKTLPATDPDGPSLTYTITQMPTHGTITGFDSTTGAYTYTPTVGYSGQDSLHYTVSDGTATSATGVVSISVTNVADAPTIQSVSSTAPNTTTGTITYTVTVTDPDTPLEDLVLTVSNPNVGTLGAVQTTAPGTYTFTYTPTQLGRMLAGSTLSTDYDSFTITVSDGVHSTTTTAPAEIYTGTMLTSAGGLVPGLAPQAMVGYGDRLYVANAGSNTVAIYNTTTGAMLPSIAVGGKPTSLALSADGSTLYVANSTGNSVSVIDTASGTVTKTITGVTNPLGVAVTGTGANTRLYVTNGSTHTVTVLDPASGLPDGSPINVGGKPVGIAINSDGTKAYVANSTSGTVTVIDTATRTVTMISVGTTPQQVALGKDGTRLYVTNTGSDNVSVIDTTTNTVIATITVGDAPYGITVSNDGSVAYVTNGNNTVSVLNLLNNTKVTGTIVAETGSASGVAMDANGRLFVSYSGGATIRYVTMTHIADPPPPAPANSPISNTEAVQWDFDGPAGQKADASMWNYWLGAGGDGRIMVLTDRAENASLDGNGNLVITAIKGDTQDQLGGTWPYSSAFLETDDKFEFTYGTVSARIDFPTDVGLHPTFWLLGTDYDRIGWPNTGEIDILDSYAPFAGSGIHAVGAYNVYEQVPIDISDGFHTYWTKWEPDKITVGVDDITYAVYTPDSLPPGTPWTFNDRAMYLNLSLDVGGPYGVPDPNLPDGWSSSMVVDWISYTPLEDTTA